MVLLWSVTMLAAMLGGRGSSMLAMLAVVAQLLRQYGGVTLTCHGELSIEVYPKVGRLSPRTVVYLGSKTLLCLRLYVYGQRLSFSHITQKNQTSKFVPRIVTRTYKEEECKRRSLDL